MFALIYFGGFSQDNSININIINSGVYNENTKEILERTILMSNVTKKYDQVKVSLVNPYNNYSKTTIASISNRKWEWKSNLSFDKRIENTAFRNAEEFITKINEKFDNSKSIVYVLNDTDSFDLKLFKADVFRYRELKKRLPIIKKLNEFYKSNETVINIVLLT